MFNEAILLKIKRNYSHDEAVNFLQAELSKANFKVGELTSENEELKHEISKLRKEITSYKPAKKKPQFILTKEDLLDARIVELQKAALSLKQTNKRLSGDVDFWRSKWMNEEARKNKIVNNG